MSESEFYYWLQGAFEIAGISVITDAQKEIILRHVAFVATRVAPLPNGVAKVEAVLGVDSPEERARLVQGILALMFVHIDKQHPNPTAADFAHFGHGHRPGPLTYRC